MAKIKPLTKSEIAEHRKLIDRLGGPTAVADIILQRLETKITPQNVSNWRMRGIPADYRPCLAVVAGERDIGVPMNFLNPGKLPQPKDAEVPFL